MRYKSLERRKRFMKRCTKCNKEYGDDKVFCPECGSSLISTAADGTGGATTTSGINGNQNISGKPAAPVSESPWYVQWRGTILAVVGLIIEWELSALLGAVLIGVGFILGKDSPASGNKIVTTVLLVIGIILLVVTMAA